VPPVDLGPVRGPLGRRDVARVLADAVHGRGVLQEVARMDYSIVSDLTADLRRQP
jgi:hypothetical protein